ncbi:hypothetical protein ABIE44_003007 [Marmoricola sp. OAE513]|uniref:hypothetical protein n=1 Tax=Marmoricola sp. OAE513 TaxID=2817894 RepID=UPI001AE52BF0
MSTFTPTTGGPAALVNILNRIKADFDGAVLTAGAAGLTSMTRSAKPVKRMHQHVGDLVVAERIPQSWVGLEQSIATRFGDKRQDVVVIPRGRTKPTGETTLSIGVKSAMRGIQKNKDNHFSGIRAEMFNLHETFPNIVCGHVLIIAVKEWDTAAAQGREIAYKRLSPNTLAEMIQRYGRVSGRKTGESIGDAERLALILADFSTTPVTHYKTVADLERDGFLHADSGLTLTGLDIDTFAADLIGEHRSRHTGANRL